MDEAADPKQLIKQAKLGDAEAFDKLYRLYLTPIYRYIYLRVQNKQLAEDLVQTVFLKIYKSLDKIVDFGKPPLAYFFTISRNTVIDHYRSSQNRITDSLDKDMADMIADKQDSALHTLEKADQLKDIRRHILKLSPDQQEVIILKFINDLSNKEISAAIGKSEEAIRQLQSRALKNLRGMLKDQPQ